MYSTSQRQVDKQAKIQTNAKGAVIEQPNVQKHAHQLKDGQQESKSAEKR